MDQEQQQEKDLRAILGLPEGGIPLIGALKLVNKHAGPIGVFVRELRQNFLFLDQRHGGAVKNFLKDLEDLLAKGNP